MRKAWASLWVAFVACRDGSRACATCHDQAEESAASVAPGESAYRLDESEKCPTRPCSEEPGEWRHNVTPAEDYRTALPFDSPHKGVRYAVSPTRTIGRAKACPIARRRAKSWPRARAGVSTRAQRALLCPVRAREDCRPSEAIPRELNEPSIAERGRPLKYTRGGQRCAGVARVPRLPRVIDCAPERGHQT